MSFQCNLFRQSVQIGAFKYFHINYFSRGTRDHSMAESFCLVDLRLRLSSYSLYIADQGPSCLENTTPEQKWNLWFTARCVQTFHFPTHCMWELKLGMLPVVGTFLSTIITSREQHFSQNVWAPQLKVCNFLLW